jgi:hypothetical protein
MRIPIMAFVAVVLVGVTGASGQRVKDDSWNPEHINQLPAEVRTAVLAKCPTVPTAGHYFVTYFHDQINLHSCIAKAQRPAFATARGAFIRFTN